MEEHTTHRLEKVLLFVNLKKENAPSAADEIRTELARRKIEVHSYTFEGKLETKVSGGYDIAFSLGGDGTVLYAARSMAPAGVPIIPVNMGTLGFIAAVKREEWTAVLSQWVEGKVRVSMRFMLNVRVERQGCSVMESVCLNDAVISASGIAKLIRLRVKSEFFSSQKHIDLGVYRSDGLIFATPTGSTGYSMAAGGPILDPEMEGIILNPICPFTLSNRPMVLPPREAVIVEVEQDQRSGVLLTVDGQITEPLEPGDRIILKQAPFKAQLVSSDRMDFYKALRTKLNWSGTYGVENA
ncbi:MAG: NAD(+)/NADH kinase [Treponema sp.]|jgi:NAD+ kinase|nr:NAD(+)/NADH kinase [Treponema sp.]